MPALAKAVPVAWANWVAARADKVVRAAKAAVVAVANWVAAPTPEAACGSPGFSGAPVWLVQESAVWPPPSGYDSDWAC